MPKKVMTAKELEVILEEKQEKQEEIDNWLRINDEPETAAEILTAASDTLTSYPGNNNIIDPDNGSVNNPNDFSAFIADQIESMQKLYDSYQDNPDSLADLTEFDVAMLLYTNAVSGSPHWTLYQDSNITDEIDPWNGGISSIWDEYQQTNVMTFEWIPR